MDIEASEFRVAHFAPLTKREAEVLLWTAEGKTAWESGRILDITEGTVRIHLAHILEKLNAANKPHAVARGFSVGLIAKKLALAVLVAASWVPSQDCQAARVPRRPIPRVMRIVRSPSLAGFKRGLYP